MLTVDNITLKKNEKIIFENLGFSLFLGSAMIISGKNGSGKTSLLKIIAGLLKEVKGKILWHGENVRNFYDDFSGDIKFIGHNNFFKEELTVLENLEFYTKLHYSEMLIPSALKFFKLEEKCHEKIKNLSAGFKKRAHLSCLICCPATIWILDEPTNNLDFEGKRLLKGLIETKIENGEMVIISTHDEDFFKLGPKLNIEDFIL